MTRKFRNSSNGCESCRIEWRKGRFSRAFALLALMAAASATWFSGLDFVWKVFLTLIWMFEAGRGYQAGVGWDAGVIEIDQDRARVRGAVVNRFKVTVRGRCVLLSWRDALGRNKTLCLWPGDVSATHLRELRQTLDAPVDAPHTPLLST